MELDSRIIEGKRPLTCFDSEYAKQFIGKKGFVAGELTQFCDLNETDETTLKNVYQNKTGCFVTSLTRYKYFLPSEWVQEPEKKYRPFTNEEFLALFDSGKLHSIRKKNEKGRYIITDVYFNDDYEKDTVFVRLNNCDAGAGMRYLVNNGYEYFDGEDWQPFGVKE